MKDKKILNFSSETRDLILNKKEFIVNEFFEKNLITRTIENKNIQEVQKIYENSIFALANNEIEDFAYQYVRLAKLYTNEAIPYIVFINELNHMQNIFLEMLINSEKKDELVSVYKIYRFVQNIVAKEYFFKYIDSLVSISNKRISSLVDMVDINVVEHYKSHLEWLLNLAYSLKEHKEENFPQTDHNLCKFGQWLVSDGKSIIKNNSKQKELNRIHSQLHYISSQVKQIVFGSNDYDYDVLLTYLEKCELLSLSIGTELALIDNTIVNQKATKDTLTGALGRKVLAQLFYNQYEISLATSSKFVLAMCDLDHFKSINDTYGHIAGDKLLKTFVKVVQKNLRSSDIIIRYGGEEFLLLLPAIDKINALKVLDKIRDDFSQTILKHEENDVFTTVSMGAIEILAEEKYKNDMLDDFISFADKKLYEAKNDGRNIIK